MDAFKRWQDGENPEAIATNRVKPIQVRASST
jgi:hypothetical protein